MAHVLPSVAANTRDTVHQLFSFIEAQGQGDYLGEAVSQLEHSLQAAHLAKQAGADDDTVLGALLHDVGRFIPNAKSMPPMYFDDGTYAGSASHEVLGENYLRYLGFTEKICQLVGAHVIAKRYLCATEKGYWDDLSKSSKTTLKYQGGPFTGEEVKQAQKDPWLQEKLQVRRWDDLAKVKDMKTEQLSDFEDMAVSALNKSRGSFELHGRTFNLPQRPTVVVCVDGFDPDYLQKGIDDGILPTMASFIQKGFHETAEVTMPTFTNTNNCSIITGQPASVHGINGNYFLDKATKEEVMIQDDSLLRGSTILAECSKRGVRVAALTAKDKLRKIIQRGLNMKTSYCFSSEKADATTKEENGLEDVEAFVGRPKPDRLSGELSLYMLDAGVKLLEQDKADLFYLTMSDYIQHKYAPGDKESDAFLKGVDERLKRLVDLGAVVAVTGDHGMSAKSNSDGTPNVLFLQDELEARFGKGCCRVICPITDPFAGHHAGLGSFVRVYVDENKTDKVDEMLKLCREFPQVDLALDGKTACERFNMPLDREGDIAVVTAKNAVIGAKSSEHDLSNLTGHSLRSHGGLSEIRVPLMLSDTLAEAAPRGQRTWHNYDAFEIALNR